MSTKSGSKILITTTSCILALCLLVSASTTQATVRIKSCFQELGLQNPHDNMDALYIFVDQTTFLTKAMKTNVLKLVSDWGENGERVKILRFSANIKGQYTELMFNESVEAIPSEEYLFHLRTRDKKNLLVCLQKNRENFQPLFKKTLLNTLEMTKQTLPKTDLFYSLQQMSIKTMQQKDEQQRTVLLISDGLENSDFLRLHGKGNVTKVNVKRSMKKLKKHKLIAQWDQADIYMYGLGHISNKDAYIRPKLIEPLKQFWHYYFSAGKGRVKQLGTPEILLSTIK